MTPTHLASGLLVVFVGCIGGAERSRDDGDTTASDAADTSDTSTTDATTGTDASTGTTTPTDIVTGTTADIGTDTTDTAEPGTCDEADDCGEPRTCNEWDCVDERCVTAPRDGPCDDDNACTGDGVCDDGTCLPGPRLECDVYSVCGRPACDPERGCVDELVQEGFCLAETVPSKDSTWGACNGIRMAPPDACTADGVCSEQSTTINTPLPKDLVVGDWYIAMQSALPGNIGTLAGLTTFDPNGTWSSNALITKDGPLDLSQVAQRGWCIDADGGLAMDIAANHTVGQLDPAGEAFTTSGALGNEVVVGVRPTGTVAGVDGAYAAVFTAESEAKVLTVWTGTLTFESGCLDEGSSFFGGGPSPFFVESTNACFALPTGKLTSIQLQASASANETTETWTLRGALGPRSDTILLSRFADDDALAAGMLFAVRLSNAPADGFGQRSQWAFAFQELDPRSEVATYRGAPGLLTFDGMRLSQGLFGRSIQVLGEHIVLDDYGRFVIPLRTPDQRRNLSGYLAPSTGIGYFYEVNAPPGWQTTFDVGEAPAWPSFGIIVRRGHGQ